MSCSHLTQLTTVELPDSPAVCVACVKDGSTWVHLRTCQTCGLTHCCDSSEHQHATKHYHTSLHPVIASAEPGERWIWCYIDNQLAHY